MAADSRKVPAKGERTGGINFNAAVEIVAQRGIKKTRLAAAIDAGALPPFRKERDEVTGVITEYFDEDKVIDWRDKIFKDVDVALRLPKDDAEHLVQTDTSARAPVPEVPAEQPPAPVVAVAPTPTPDDEDPCLTAVEVFARLNIKTPVNPGSTLGQPPYSLHLERKRVPKAGPPGRYFAYKLSSVEAFDAELRAGRYPRIRRISPPVVPPVVSPVEAEWLTLEQTAKLLNIEAKHLLKNMSHYVPRYLTAKYVAGCADPFFTKESAEKFAGSLTDVRKDARKRKVLPENAPEETALADEIALADLADAVAPAVEEIWLTTEQVAATLGISIRGTLRLTGCLGAKKAPNPHGGRLRWLFTKASVEAHAADHKAVRTRNVSRRPSAEDAARAVCAEDQRTDAQNTEAVTATPATSQEPQMATPAQKTANNEPSLTFTWTARGSGDTGFNPCPEIGTFPDVPSAHAALAAWTRAHAHDVPPKYLLSVGPEITPKIMVVFE